MAQSKTQSAGATQSGLHDLLIITDATGSMSAYLRALNVALPDIIRISSLTNCFSRIGVLAYRDYSQTDPSKARLTEWSGWSTPGEADEHGVLSQDRLIHFARRLTVGLGGGAEAAKTGLAFAHSVMHPSATTFILFFADQTPHLHPDLDEETSAERVHLRQPGVYGDSGPLFLDWVKAANTLASGEKKAQVFCLIDAPKPVILGPYVYLSTVTRGNCYSIRARIPDDIAAVSISILLAWMGLSKAGASGSIPSDVDIATSYSYANPQHVFDISYEQSDDFATSVRYLLGGGVMNMARQYLTGSSASVKTTTTVFKRGEGISVDHGRKPVLQDLSKRYAADAEFRIVVARQLMDIIKTNVLAITTNPVFGTLWRAVANDRFSPSRDALTQAFGEQVEKMPDYTQRMTMKAWLEESYNFGAEILEMIRSVPSERQFPCVFMDPTQDFSSMKDGNGGRESATLVRSHLLEISRSCDPAILRRLGKALTRLSYAKSEKELPKHIKDASLEQVPRIPTALAEAEYGRQLWKCLLHLICPGTKLAARPAALLAALSNRMGMLPLRDAADRELLAYSDKWNSITVPETWNASCLSLLLDADRDYEKRVEEGITARPEPNARVLSVEDRQLFQTLIDYKMLEINMGTTLTARIGWKPSQSKVAMGPVVICNMCRLPRSVTVMGPGGHCGICRGKKDCKSVCCQLGPNHESVVQINVSTSDTELTEAAWFECSMINCRSQYVVYNVNNLNVRPKCHYCRHSSAKSEYKAPFVECVQCLSRIIWPLEYRPKDLDLAAYKCTACTGGNTTIVDHVTTARRLCHENGQGWILRNDDQVIEDPFNDRSLFHTASNTDLSTLASKVAVLPEAESVKLTVGGKLVRNPEDLRRTLAEWVSRREAELGCCALCFSDLPKKQLRSACGRRGCLSEICATCHSTWYGLNEQGAIINLAALCCPFCRRQPTPQSVPVEVGQLKGLREAVADPSWIYAWCMDCGFAKQYMERVCANGAPPELIGWVCEPCEEQLNQGVPKARRKVMMCPGCDTATAKTGGCDHITCPCGTHWCFECGQAFSSSGIYDHMSEAHGGLYGGYDYDYSGDEEEY